MSRGGCSSDLAGMGCDTGCCAVWAPPFPQKAVGGSAPAICGALFLPVSLPFKTASERTQVGVRDVLKVALLMFLKPANQLHGCKVRPSLPLRAYFSQSCSVYPFAMSQRAL